ncbi:MAG: DDE transposase family protein, partial [Herbaspirillum sp.]|nr:DDE transposase family protein [Herbaspirillum sp.]
MQYYVTVLEANLAFCNGMTIPLMTEFLSCTADDTDAQDCETKAFHRLACRLKKEFPRLPVMVLLDGLYPNGPITEHCPENKWQFMIVFQGGSLPSVWEEFEALKELQEDNRVKMKWGNRKQCFQWVNEIEYRYGENGKKKIVLHVVVCEETWEKVNSS